jgi:hypothetical protein
VIAWKPGDGSDTVVGGPGSDTLRVEMTGMTAGQFLAAIAIDPPGDGDDRLAITLEVVDGKVNVSGLSGSITIGGEVIRFSEIEHIELAGWELGVWGRWEAP